MELILSKEDVINIVTNHVNQHLLQEAKFDHWESYIGDGMVFTRTNEVTPRSVISNENMLNHIDEQELKKDIRQWLIDFQNGRNDIPVDIIKSYDEEFGDE